jgi:hypothetical protein
MSCSGCITLDIAKMLACMHDGGVWLASNSKISLSTCGSHSVYPPELVRKVGQLDCKWRKSKHMETETLITST